MHDRLDIGVAVAAAREQVGDALQINDCIEIARALLGAVAAVEIGPDRRVSRVTGR